MFILLGLAFAYGAAGLRIGSAVAPGAGFFPLALAVLLTMLGAVVLFNSLTIEREGGDVVGVIAWRALIFIVSAVALSGWGLQHLGLLVTVPIMVVLGSLATGGFNWKDSLANTVLLCGLSWAVFVLWRDMSIPLWPVFF